VTALSVASFYTLNAQSTFCPPLPRNSYRVAKDDNPCAWLCHTGYFQTLPSNLLDSTCRPCSPYVCNLGQAYTPCGGRDDTTCTQCPPQRETVYTSNTSCDNTQCANGYFSNHPSQNLSTCQICDRGFFCAHAVAYRCGHDETTYAIGSSSPLFCQPTLASPVANNIQVTINYFIPTDQPPPTPANVMSSLAWVQYGSVSNCRLSLAQQNVQCWATVGPSVSGLYLLWLQNLLSSSEAISKLQTSLASALQAPTLSVISTEVTPNFAYLEHSATHPPPPSAPTLVPLLQLSPLIWGSAPQDVATTLAFVAALLSLLMVACTVLLAIAVFQCKYRRAIRRVLENLSATHKLDLDLNLNLNHRHSYARANLG
jgi:hypothetical protein